MLDGIIASSIAALVATTEIVWVGHFSTPGAPPAPWRMVSLSGTRPTSYRVAIEAGRPALEASVDRSMSLMSRPITVDLKKTPMLCWRWMVSGPVKAADMTRRSGDDYAARVYVAFDVPDSELSGSAKMKLRIARSLFSKNIPDAAVVYVWDNTHPVGTTRKSSYTDRSQLIVTESGSAKAGQWVAERADVAADFAKAFPDQSGIPTNLAVAADGDNTNSKGRAAFADIHFVARDTPCRS